MVVKSKRGRIRYIVFDVSPNMRKDILIKNLKAFKPNDAPYVVQCADGKAIVRCTPHSAEETMRTMSQADPSCVSLMTSGTLRTIREKYPALKMPKKQTP